MPKAVPDHDLLKQILVAGRPHWDHDKTVGTSAVG